MPRKDGTMSKDQRPEADVNIEYQLTSKYGDQAMVLALKFQLANFHFIDQRLGAGLAPTDSDIHIPGQSYRVADAGSRIGDCVPHFSRASRTSDR